MKMIGISSNFLAASHNRSPKQSTNVNYNRQNFELIQNLLLGYKTVMMGAGGRQGRHPMQCVGSRMMYR